ncbi:enoyl-CoA hydratase-related protein [Aquisalimonas lutea]|uniref:enoyl-CoA hydratase-related protein n=1 Tax=Aquisalimonas lutea TaxID=1327750 RepID=UPI0025B527FF|nr:enoyl-CoA hydratase-related protein [Aquisalimonas lutea]MDN3518195.1 enoyl-CoA hydratase-related protein [Aquisalimonas lutea]
MGYEYIVVSTHGSVGEINLNRPDAMNALCAGLMEEVGTALTAFAADDTINAVLITGGEKAFAAGADIKDMAHLNCVEAIQDDFPFSASGWTVLKDYRKPVVAAVAGYCLGGGCELAMSCDFIVAADTARFGQPEVKLAIMPGAGGTQRMARAVGKARAMELCLTGRLMDAEEALQAGLVAYTTSAGRLHADALATAQRIAAHSSTSTQLIKESINQAFEMPLSSGLLFERRMFQTCFATEDRTEGVNAFIEKRPPAFRNR